MSRRDKTRAGSQTAIKRASLLTPRERPLTPLVPEGDSDPVDHLAFARWLKSVYAGAGLLPENGGSDE